MKTIAIVGIDGSGKSTFVKKVVGLFEADGVATGHLDLPYLTEVFRSKLWNKLWLGLCKKTVEKKISTIIICLIASLILYPIARFKMREKDLIIIEHDPSLEISIYLDMYIGAIGSLVGKFLQRFFPKPEITILLDLTVSTAYQRILARGKSRQPHETPADLTSLRHNLKQAVWSSSNCFILENPDPEKFVEKYLAGTLEVMVLQNAAAPT